MYLKIPCIFEENQERHFPLLVGFICITILIHYALIDQRRSTLNAHFRIDANKSRENVVRQASTLCKNVSLNCPMLFNQKRKLASKIRKIITCHFLLGMKGHTPSDLFILVIAVIEQPKSFFAQKIGVPTVS